jgi:hypothetical protein
VLREPNKADDTEAADQLYCQLQELTAQEGKHTLSGVCASCDKYQPSGGVWRRAKQEEWLLNQWRMAHFATSYLARLP